MKEPITMRVGIEVGGTFTDLVAIGESGVSVFKVPSTPAHPEQGAMNALKASGIDISKIEELAHGSTVATNAVLERKGFPIAFITTMGFRDILSLQRHGRNQIYDLAYQKPLPVVDRASTFEVRERILADGSVLVPMNEESVEQELLPLLRSGRFEAVAICLLNSYINDLHEERLKRLIKRNMGSVSVTISSDVSRQFREFERASTATLSAYVQPVMDRYITRFRELLAQGGFKGRFSIIQSNGGRLSDHAMRDNAVTALLSGPAAGVTGAVRQATRSGVQNLITLDIGGTSTDVSVVTNGKPQLTEEFTIGGLPARIPVIDINTVGAGGGSIVWIDEGGMLRVGPHSAGAVPGPACYGKGGEAPTITDAHVVRQTMRPEAFLGGRMKIDRDAARRALQPIAEALGMNVEDAADSAILLANSNIVGAIQLISTERGYDPRDYVLVPYGGAGPLHAASVAEELGISKVMIPPNSGVISAYGLLASDFVFYETRTQRIVIDEKASSLVGEAYSEMRSRAEEKLQTMGLGLDCEFRFVADMRFVGQAFEVSVEIPAERIQAMAQDELRSLFIEAHHKVFFFGGGTGKQVEIVSFRLGTISLVEDKPVLTEVMAHQLETREIDLHFGREWHKGKLISRVALKYHEVLFGPAIVEDVTSTSFIPSGWQAIKDSNDNVLVSRGGCRVA